MHLYVIKLEQKESKKTRNKLFNFLRKSGIGANLHYIPIHLQPFYRRLGFKKIHSQKAKNILKEL